MHNQDGDYIVRGDFGILIDSHGEEMEDELAYLSYWKGMENLEDESGEA